MPVYVNLSFPTPMPLLLLLLLRLPLSPLVQVLLPGSAIQLRTIMWHMHLCAMASESFVGALAPSSVLCRVAKHYFVEHLHSHGANATKLAALKAPSPRALFLRSEPMTQNRNHHPESKTQSTDAQASVEEQELQGLLEIQSAYSVASMQSAVEF
ncbi:hypothetical protein C4D60_Mb04t34850 [Musa balbisiana]|uniref:Secreted protein n=1 Tax=Musa balbisiana TaxID=52838 RepID=A0A4S8KGY3_MUSBA|nr:hypothetical protein C4D60_Mb04t34850 [Musa balbisiana]